MHHVIEIPGGQLDREIRAAHKPLLVQFYTSWSDASRLQVPMLEKLADQLGSEMEIRKTNLDHHPELARHHHISSVPTLILFDTGSPIARLLASMSPRELTACLQGLLRDYAPQKGIASQL
jgi:thioredoxin-like negative regulator of GroEL